MSYKPIGYIVEYEISAVTFLIIIMIRYFDTRRFPNQKNRLFTMILWITLVDMILDILSSFAIDNVFSVPTVITYSLNTLFYILQILMPFLMTAYTMSLSRRLNWRTDKGLIVLTLPGLAIFVILLVNPVTHWFFYVDAALGYTHGPAFIYGYFVILYYMAFTLYTAIRDKARLSADKFNTILRFLSIILASMVLQYFYPPLLISGVAMAISVTLMYFTIQDPKTMLDVNSGAFTYEAMLAFLNDRVQECEYVQLIAVRIYNMSRVNELIGIENGSSLYRQLSCFMLSCVKDAWVFRMRGNCFVAITSKMSDYRLLSDKLQARVQQPWIINGAEVVIQATVCCVATEELLDAPIAPADAVHYLDAAFLQNERLDKRLKSVVIGPELLSRITRARTVESALRAALEGDTWLELYFQPLWSVQQKRFTGAEVLLRFKHPVMGFIPPDEFVPIAENTGLATALDELVLRKVCAFIRNNAPRTRLGLESIEVNLSALEFIDHGLPRRFGDIMAEYEIDPSFLCFEITETAATESFEHLKASMEELCAKGCHFALDDFGTGYANISKVLQLPFSMVKLDCSLLYGEESVLRDVVDMFAHMRRHIVVEGVETSAQAALMKTMLVDSIQGYYYAHPMNERDFILFLLDNEQFKQVG